MVVGTDFSEGSAAALTEARRLEEWVRAHVTLVHVVEHGAGEWSRDTVAGDWLAAHEVRASDILILRGNPAVGLVRFALSINALA
ncbi:MAG: universal stress protein, partial [Gemmatimonadota bacterium]